MTDIWQSERDTVLRTFSEMLARVTGDGSRKRQAGLKPPWWCDTSHEAAIFSHLNKWKHQEYRHPESGAHPLVHLAWRALAIAYQETQGRIAPEGDKSAWDNYPITETLSPDSPTARKYQGLRDNLDRLSQVRQ